MSRRKPGPGTHTIVVYGTYRVSTTTAIIVEPIFVTAPANQILRSTNTHSIGTTGTLQQISLQIYTSRRDGRPITNNQEPDTSIYKKHMNSTVCSASARTSRHFYMSGYILGMPCRYQHAGLLAGLLVHATSVLIHLDACLSTSNHMLPKQTPAFVMPWQSHTHTGSPTYIGSQSLQCAARQGQACQTASAPSAISSLRLCRHEPWIKPHVLLAPPCHALLLSAPVSCFSTLVLPGPWKTPPRQL